MVNDTIDNLIDNLEPVFNKSFSEFCIEMDNMHLSADIQNIICDELVSR